MKDEKLQAERTAEILADAIQAVGVVIGKVGQAVAQGRMSVARTQNLTELLKKFETSLHIIESTLGFSANELSLILGQVDGETSLDQMLVRLQAVRARLESAKNMFVQSKSTS